MWARYRTVRRLARPVAGHLHPVQMEHLIEIIDKQASILLPGILQARPEVIVVDQFPANGIVVISFESGIPVNSWYQWETIADDPLPVWSPFHFDGTTGAVLDTQDVVVIVPASVGAAGE